MKSSSMLKSILIAIILSLCVCGIGYASWSVSLSTNTIVETGTLELSFVNMYSIDPLFEDRFTVSITSDTVNIIGTVDSEETLVPITFYVNNTGSLPLKLGDKLIGAQAIPEELQLHFDCASENQTLVYSLANNSQSWTKSLYINCDIKTQEIQNDLIADSGELSTKLPSAEVPVESLSENAMASEGALLSETALPSEEELLSEGALLSEEELLPAPSESPQPSQDEKTSSGDIVPPDVPSTESESTSESSAEPAVQSGTAMPEEASPTSEPIEETIPQSESIEAPDLPSEPTPEPSITP